MSNISSFVGLGNIVISEVDGTVYINTSSQISPSIKGSLSFYDEDNKTSLIGTGKNLIWNEGASRLETNALRSKDIEVDELKVKTLVSIKKIDAEELTCDFIKIDTYAEIKKIDATDLICKSIEVDDRFASEQIIGNKWIGFQSLVVPQTQPFKFQITLDDEGFEVLILKTNDYNENTESKAVIGFESQRVIIPEALNIMHRTIKTPQGTDKDKKGDIAIDENYIYVCINDYDGSKNIWKRSSLKEW